MIGEVQSYREDSAKVLINGQHVDTNLLVNFGILVGYSIQRVVQALEQGLRVSAAAAIGGGLDSEKLRSNNRFPA
jgi:hypothetical protein